MNINNLIKKKQKGQKLNFKECFFIVQNYSKNKINDQEMENLIDVFIENDMSDQETMHFFNATFQEAKKIDLSKIDGFKIDKHSTGGVGDKVTLVMLPILTALGIKSFKFSGGRLGFTGGTIEKLETFPGINLKLSIKEFQEKAKKNDLVLSHTVSEISTFEKKLYHLRNITKKTEVLGMVVNSVMIKKMLLSNDGLIIDVKNGSGAFIKNLASAIKFCNLAVEIAKQYKRSIVLVITNMNEPIGKTIGNKLEIIETFEALSGKGAPDLMEIVYTLVYQALSMSKKVKNFAEAKSKIDEVINSGLALKHFQKFVESQNGDFNAVYKNQKIQVKNKIVIQSWTEGYLSFPNVSKIGLFVNKINVNNNKVDYDAGIILNKKGGQFVKKDEVIATILTNQNEKDKLKIEFEKLIKINEMKIKTKKTKINQIIKHF